MTLSNDASVGPEAERRPAGSGTRQRTGQPSARLERRPWSGSGHAHASEVQPSYWAECLFILNPGPIVSLRGTWNRTELWLCNLWAQHGRLSVFTRRKESGSWGWLESGHGKNILAEMLLFVQELFIECLP